MPFLRDPQLIAGTRAGWAEGLTSAVHAIHIGWERHSGGDSISVMRRAATAGSSRFGQLRHETHPMGWPPPSRIPRRNSRSTSSSGEGSGSLAG